MNQACPQSASRHAPNLRHNLVGFATSAALLALLALTAACSKTPDNGAAASSTPSASSGFSQTGSATAGLGDLTAFQVVVADVIRLVDKGELTAAKTRVKALEVAWDQAEAGLKPRAASDWHVLDKAIDRALTELRRDTPNQADAQKALAALSTTLASLQAQNTQAGAIK